jgi:hypothetical protein
MSLSREFSMPYDPSTRGTATVGVRTIVLRDENREAERLKLKFGILRRKYTATRIWSRRPRTGFR